MNEEQKTEVEEQEDALIDGLCDLFHEVTEIYNSKSDLLSSLKKEGERYSDKEFLAEGGMKRIYKCRDLQSDRLVAMAELLDSKSGEALNDFLREARINAYLQHPNIVPVYEVGLSSDNSPFFTMKLIEGKNLGEILEEGDYSLNQLISIYMKCCEAIAYAHSKGILHLDLKPENISVSDYGEVLICDWGISEPSTEILRNNVLAEEDFYKLLPMLKSERSIRGSLAYLSPEQIDQKLGEKSARTDIYALGVLLYKILTKREPFSGRKEQVFDKITKGEYSSPTDLSPDVPKSLEAVCLKAMSCDKLERYESVDEILNEIERFQHGYATKAEEASVWDLVVLLCKRNKLSCLVSGISFIIICLLIIYSFSEIKKSESLAVQQKNKAIASKNEAMELYTKLKSEQVLKLEMASKAAKKYLENFNNAVYFRNFSSIQKSMDIAWSLAAHDQQVQSKYGYYLISRLKFDEGKKILEQAGVSFSDTIPDNEDLLDFEAISRVSQFLAKQKLSVYFLHNCLLLDWPIDQQVKILELQIKSNRSKCNLDIQLIDGGVFLDISNNSMGFPGSLKTVNIKSLDISNTNISKPDFLPWSTLETLNASGSELRTFRESAKLKRLIIRGCKSTNFNSLKKLPKLEYLDIRDNPSFPSQLLLQLPSLKEVTMDHSQLTEKLKKKAKFKIAVY
ncbi:MAG: serine/threonine protein kinase [Lentisphaerales bacterium]|nr:serine/threonine protein kinase [Lentisphaerales bacterium]